MRWYRVWKTYSSGSNETYLNFNDESSIEHIEYEIVDWGELDGNGSNNGYSLHYEQVECPPKKWLLNKKQRHIFDIEINKKNIKLIDEFLKKYERKDKLEKLINKLKL